MKWISLVLTLLSSLALADPIPGNLKPFENVCIMAASTVGTTQDETLDDTLSDLLNQQLQVHEVPYSRDLKTCTPRSASVRMVIHAGFDADTRSYVSVAQLLVYARDVPQFPNAIVWTGAMFYGTSATREALKTALVQQARELVQDFVEAWQDDHRSPFN